MLDEVVSEALNDFRQVAALARVTTPLTDIQRQILHKPHKAKTLPRNYMAVYSFFLDGRALKVGKVGPNSGPRFLSQHYTGSAKSTLRGSLLTNSARIGVAGLSPHNVADWIRINTDRVDLLIPADAGVAFLSLLEAFLHVRWNPVFEGRSVEN